MRARFLILFDCNISGEAALGNLKLIILGSRG